MLKETRIPSSYCICFFYFITTASVKLLLTVLRHLGQLRHLHVEVLAVRFVLNLAVVHRLQNLSLLGLEARQGRLQIHLLLF